MEKLINAKEAAELLNLSKATIYKLTCRQGIPFVKIGGKVLFRPSALEAWVKNREREVIS